MQSIITGTSSERNPREATTVWGVHSPEKRLHRWMTLSMERIVSLHVTVVNTMNIMNVELRRMRGRGIRMITNTWGPRWTDTYIKYQHPTRSPRRNPVYVP